MELHVAKLQLIATINNKSSLNINVLRNYLQHNNSLNSIVAIASLFPISNFQKTSFYADLTYFIEFGNIYNQINTEFAGADLQWLALYLLIIAYKNLDIVSQTLLLKQFAYLSTLPVSHTDTMIWVQHYIYITVATAQCNLKIDNTVALQKAAETNYIIAKLAQNSLN